ncbi:hypothetical protein TNCV_2924061 [Trichonephila clavipes]|nr:hypothetical protein TNCV_2924061 [Trichonephila clavipes]
MASAFSRSNPIENVWNALGRQVAGRNCRPTNKNTLIREVTEEWDKFPQQLLDNIVQINRVPLRIDFTEINSRGKRGDIGRIDTQISRFRTAKTAIIKFGLHASFVELESAKSALNEIFETEHPIGRRLKHFLFAAGQTFLSQKYRDRIYAGDIYVLRPMACIPLTEKHYATRKNWVAEYRDWMQSVWSQVLYTD